MGGAEPLQGHAFDMLGLLRMVHHSRVDPIEGALSSAVHRLSNISGYLLDTTDHLLLSVFVVAANSALHKRRVWEHIESVSSIEVADGEHIVLTTADVA